MRNVSDKLCTGNQNPKFYVHQIFAENLAVYEIMWKNTAQPNRSQMAL
jgi:hypothetical protein